MDKTYNKIVFVNNQEPDLDATNMNAISNAIDEIDNRVITLNETVEQDSEVIAQHTEAIAQNTADIEALKRKPSGITLTSASPLLSSAAAGIAGLQAKGSSTQAEGTPTPTNPISIVDASGVVEAKNKNIIELANKINAYIDDGTPTFVTNASCGALYTKCKPNTTYTVSKDIVSSRFKVGYADHIPTNGDVLKGVISNPSSTEITITTDESARYIVIWYFWATGDAGKSREQILAKMQIEEGTSKTDYVEPKTNEINLSSIGIDLRSIPNTNIADTLTVKADGSGELVQIINVKHLLENDGWYLHNKGRYYANCLENALKPSADVSIRSLSKSNHFTFKDVNESGCFALGGAGVYINDIDFESLDKLKEFIRSNDVYVQYPLATPIVHTLTAEQVAAILALQTYAGTTIVESELDEVVVDYVGDTKAYIDSKFEYLYELIRSYHPEAQMMSLNDEPTAEEEGENV